MTSTVAKITFACHGCGRAFSVPASYVGRKATCKTCGARVVVPGSSPSQASDADSPANGDSHGGNGHPHDIVERMRPANSMHGEAAISDADVLTADPTIPPAHTLHVAVISEAQTPPAAPVSTLADDGKENDRTQETEAGAPAPAAARLPMRIRRLTVDADQVKKAFTGDGPIRIKSTVGDPPELYQVEYKVTGLQRGWLGKPKKRDSHLVEIQLTSEYPRLSPKCKMLTPVFHPNIDETTVCVGDHWTAGERLVDLIIRIGQMLAYQDYNIKSPLNGEAAMWADLNPTKLPVDSQNLHLVDAL